MSLAAPERGDSYVVFGQELRPAPDVTGWQQHAARFLATHLTLATLAKDAGPPWLHAVSVVVAPIGAGEADRESFGARSCWSRPSTDDDARAAFEAESKTGLAGLSDLARRCKQVWLVGVQRDLTGDLVALRIAAILAGVVLGPILAPGGSTLIGPKTARVRLSR